MVESVAATLDIGDYILAAVTNGTGYNAAEAKGIPCCKETFYLRIKEFCCKLDKIRA